MCYASAKIKENILGSLPKLYMGFKENVHAFKLGRCSDVRNRCWLDVHKHPLRCRHISYTLGLHTRWMKRISITPSGDISLHVFFPPPSNSIPVLIVMIAIRLFFPPTSQDPFRLGGVSFQCALDEHILNSLNCLPLISFLWMLSLSSFNLPSHLSRSVSSQRLSF